MLAVPLRGRRLCCTPIVLATSHPNSLAEAFTLAVDLLDNITLMTPTPVGDEPAGAGVSYEVNEKFGFVTADVGLLGTGLVVEVRVKASARLGAALKAGRLATTCSAATLDVIEVVPSVDGASCTVRSGRTLGMTVEATLAAVTEAALALIEATKHE